MKTTININGKDTEVEITRKDGVEVTDNIVQPNVTYIITHPPEQPINIPIEIKVYD